ncbi:hypothetical protein B9Q02_12130 [Candidatus Marsarchaeota G1 archaeon BE_D]|uniref:Uncharacterized protein n=1 Tax=Candidatus Marsarchaeota G1 archaeon BE_D TaxID=1978156 RepID=A0A2R6A6X3_9ARCH|nr:MAG: hypothetical protein B9Q02_12130 [Candidatus Marsarchaeota G1 archaeon BE_D]
MVVFWVMSLKEIVEVVDRLNAIAFHVRSGRLIRVKCLSVMCVVGFILFNSLLNTSVFMLQHQYQKFKQF